MSLNQGYFDSLRNSHPVMLGDTVNGKRVVQTSYVYKKGKTHAVFHLKDDSNVWTIGDDGEFEIFHY